MRRRSAASLRSSRFAGRRDFGAAAAIADVVVDVVVVVVEAVDVVLVLVATVSSSNTLGP